MGAATATYLVPNKGNLLEKAEQIALGLTVGSWTSLPEVDQKQLAKHKGEVISVKEISDDQGLITISYPAVNFSADIPAILTTVFGKLSLDGKVKLVDLDFTPELAQRFPGPAFGNLGVRNLLEVSDRPLLMSIFKGILGRDLTFFKQQLRAQALGGVDIVKDDEILFDNPATPFEQRIDAAKKVLQETEHETGEATLYAVNLSGRSTELLEKAKRAVQLGANALLFNVFTYGLDTLQALAEDKDICIPILAHPSFGGAVTASAHYGVSAPLWYGKLLRAAGADLVLFPSPYGSVALEKNAALGIARELTSPHEKWKRALPVPSAGIHPALVPRLIEDFGMNSVINAGGGVHGHPDGAAAGGKAFRQAIQAVQKGIPLKEAAQIHKKLAVALQQWGDKGK
ncbi:2,3-diketo-5-methylthiopentyl-1-phosphate enolase [Shimazuella sp. AN120528]|uniref:2,3-diketo-5-methylthiopentyl-1-phosphate enolase n=1 Tax=Shimazuella soli TaxID=1892854 RepID=UPI001F0D0BE9|nr:2,3-diketo-5-methylthiopentyl-1-phosphate enolase [Shimazuella soli]MCH5583989.1 2,3-diketo-5-methylthiopentyl-1-phosphate enolase [Shimazuella soli]